MSTPPHSDALVFFGATGDLAYKQIFPALQAMVETRRLERARSSASPSRAGTSSSCARAPATASSSTAASIAAPSTSSARSCATSTATTPTPRTFDRLRRELGGASGRCTTSPSRRARSPTVVERARHAPGCADARARRRREAVRPRPRLGARAQPARCTRSSPSRRSSASTTTSARSRCRTCSTSASPTRSSSRVLNRDHVDNVQITMAESFGVQGRGSFYEETGAIRDVIQNHLLQVIAILAMDPPVGHDVEAIARREGAHPARRSRRSTPAHVVRGQFRGYRDEPGVARDSTRRDLRRRASCASTPGAGPACRSSSAPASACRSTPPRCSCSSSGRRATSSASASPPRTTSASASGPDVTAHRARHARQAAGRGRWSASEVELVAVEDPGARHAAVRAAARRRDARRRQPVRARGRHRGAVAHRRPGPRHCRRRRIRTSRAPGDRPRPSGSSPACPAAGTNRSIRTRRSTS